MPDKPGPDSSIERAFAYYARDPSSNTGITSFAPMAEKCATLIFQNLIRSKQLDKTANFNSLDCREKEYVA